MLRHAQKAAQSNTFLWVPEKSYFWPRLLLWILAELHHIKPHASWGRDPQWRTQDIETTTNHLNTRPKISGKSQWVKWLTKLPRWHLEPNDGNFESKPDFSCPWPSQRRLHSMLCRVAVPSLSTTTSKTFTSCCSRPHPTQDRLSYIFQRLEQSAATVWWASFSPLHISSVN